jgi:hypothetical protein
MRYRARQIAASRAKFAAGKTESHLEALRRPSQRGLPLFN